MSSSRGLPAFKLERFFAKHEFSAAYLLICSDCDALTLNELLQYADEDAMDRWSNLKFSYTETRGLPALTEAITTLYKSQTPSNVVVLAPEEGIYLAMLAMLQPGDNVVAMFPAYQSLFEVARSQGCSLTWWEPSSDANGTLKFNTQKLQELIQPGVTKLVVVNFPHNPTGFLPTHEEWVQLVSSCDAAGAKLFSDEMYRFSEPDASLRLDSAADLSPAAVSLCGVSKSWSLPGLRLGWLVSQDAALLDRVAELKDYTTICASAPSEVLALIAVRASAAITQRTRDIIATNLGHLEPFFKRWSHVFDWQPPVAGPVAFPRIRLTDVDIETFCTRLVEATGVLLLPANVYDHPPSVAAGHFRLGLGRSNLPKCLEQLEGWLHLNYPPPQ